MLLKVGRHLRPAANFKLIVSREDGENNYLEGYRKQFIHLRSVSHAGPLALIDGKPTAHDIHLAARIVARYGQGRDADLVTITAHHPDGVVEHLQVVPIPVDEIQPAWHV
jgi:hypothetical protein